MTKYLCILLAYQAVLIDGFAPTPKQKTSFAATKNIDARIESAIPAAEIEEGHEESFTGLDGKWGDVGRRQFFVSMVGAASLLALSEDATAFVGTNPLHEQEESMKSGEESLSSTILVSTDEATARPPIDTRDIIGKAAKKALGGGKGKLLYSCY